MADVTLNQGSGGSNIATNAVTRDGVTEHMELINIADGASATTATVDVNGLHVNVNGALPTGTNSIGSVTIGTALPAGTNNIGGVELLDSAGVNKLAINASGQIGLSTGPGVNASGIGQFIPITDATAKIDVGANASQDVVDGVAGKQIWVTAYFWMASLPSTGAGGLQWFDGTTSTPLTGIIAVTPETGADVGTGVGCILGPLPAGDKLTLTTTNGASVQGHLSYTQK